MNQALAKSCIADINDKEGAETRDWEKRSPIRVFRSPKIGKTNKFAPKDRFRYDGIYKVVKYWPKKANNEFI